MPSMSSEKIKILKISFFGTAFDPFSISFSLHSLVNNWIMMTHKYVPNVIKVTWPRAYKCRSKR